MEIKYYNKLCKCGCGNKIKVSKYHSQNVVPNYIKGHNNKGEKNPAKRLDVKEKLKNHHWTKNPIIKDEVSTRRSNSLKEGYKTDRISISGFAKLMQEGKIKGENAPNYKHPIKKECLYCKKLFQGSPAYMNKRKYCSCKCHRAVYNPLGNPETAKKISIKLKNRIFSKDTIRKMRESAIERIKKLGGGPSKGEHEEYILDELEKLYEYKIDRNFYIIGYKVDGYIPELNLCIEVDEPHHFNSGGNLRKKDIERQRNIEEKLNCKFLRIKDKF